MKDDALNVAVLMGGPSAEAAVSRASAGQVADALGAMGHRVETVELDADCAANLLAQSPDVVFPALHGPPGEDGTVQGFLEMLGLPYVGSGVRGSAVAMDKHVAKGIFAEYDLPVAPGVLVSHSDDVDAQVARIERELGTAVVIKPLSQGSAIGVTPLPNGGDIRAALAAGLAYGTCLVEPFVMGREITVGVLDTDEGCQAHPVIEIVTATDEWYDYENRYAVGQSEHIIPAPMSPKTTARLQEIAVTAHTVLECRDLSRADFIVTDTEEITLLEVNTLPGMTPTSLYPDGARALGYEFGDLMDYLVRRAYARR